MEGRGGTSFIVFELIELIQGKNECQRLSAMVLLEVDRSTIIEVVGNEDIIILQIHPRFFSPSSNIKRFLAILKLTFW